MEVPVEAVQTPRFWVSLDSGTLMLSGQVVKYRTGQLLDSEQEPVLYNTIKAAGARVRPASKIIICSNCGCANAIDGSTEG